MSFHTYVDSQSRTRRIYMERDDDPRGTPQQLIDVRRALNEFDAAMRRQIPSTYMQLKRTVVKSVRPKLETLAFTKWYDYVTAQYTKALNPKDNTVKTKQPKELKKKTYNTVGVRFLRGTNLHKAYTYRVPKKVKLHIGEEIVVPSLAEGYEANSIAVVVELHSSPQDTQGFDYKFITGRILAVKAA